jgi:ABC-type amino acid transport substrate-binding protein
VQEETPSSSKKWIVGTFVSPPFAMKNALGNWEGIAIDLWQTIALEQGLNYSFKEVPEDKIVSELASGKIDLIAGALIVTPEREREIEFSQVFFTSDLGIGILKKTSPNILLVLIRTFCSWEFLQVILAACGVLLLAGFLIWLLERRHDPSSYGGHWLKGIFQGFYWSGAMMSGCCDKAPLSVHGRLFAIVWIFVGIFLTSSFTASIANILTVEHLAPRIVSSQDLPRHHVAVVRGTYEPMLRAQQTRFTAYQTEKEAIEAVISGQKDACVIAEPALKYYAGKYFSDKLWVVPMSCRRVFYAFGFTQNFSGREALNKSLLNITASPEWNETLERYQNH